ncbi:hypothetical protein [Candidatus Jettenia sp. AMX1]|nr:hypothetical protein [Candidatus Jettenia sp. AMX1]MDL1939901.1 acetyltransferase [Candidatus Jettenia sp. AMX1]
MGHRKMAGLVKEQTIGSASFIRIDVPDKHGNCIATQFYNPEAVYCMTPTTRELAMQFAASHSPSPVTRYELPPCGHEDDDDMNNDAYGVDAE